LYDLVFVTLYYGLRLCKFGNYVSKQQIWHSTCLKNIHSRRDAMQQPARAAPNAARVDFVIAYIPEMTSASISVRHE
jgi:hypothetical protein